MAGAVDEALKRMAEHHRAELELVRLQTAQAVFDYLFARMRADGTVTGLALANAMSRFGVKP